MKRYLLSLALSLSFLIAPSLYAKGKQQPVQKTKATRVPKKLKKAKLLSSLMAHSKIQVFRCKKESKDAPIRLGANSTKRPAFLKKQVLASSYPNADYYIYRSHETYVLDTKGKVKHKLQRSLKFFNHQAIDHHGDPRFAFDSKKQILSPIKTRTFLPNGRVKFPKCNSYNVVLPSPMARAPAYSDIKQLVLTHVGLELGAITDLEIERVDRVRRRSYLWGEKVVQADQPAGSFGLTVIVPKGTKLHYACLRCSLHPTIIRNKKSTIYRWIRTDVPALNPEGISHGFYPSLYPRIVFYTAPSWKELHSLLQTRMAKATVFSTALSKRIAKLTRAKVSSIEKVRVLHHFVVHYTQTTKWPLNSFDFQARTANLVYDSAYGHALDKAVLLAAMLKQVGISTKLAMVALKGSTSVNVPSLFSFTRPVLQLNIDGRPFWLDPTRTSVRYKPSEWEGRYILSTSLNRVYQLNESPSHRHQSLLSACLKISKKALLGQFNLRFMGSFNPFGDSVMALSPSAHKILKSKAVLVGGKVSKLKVQEWGLGASAASFRGLRSLTKANKAGFMAITLPQLSPAYSLKKIEIYRESRKTTLILPTPLIEKTNILIKLPKKGCKPFILPSSFSIRNLVGRVIYKTSYDAVSRHIVYFKEFVVFSRYIKPVDYPSFRKLYLAYLNPHQHRIILKK